MKKIVLAISFAASLMFQLEAQTLQQNPAEASHDRGHERKHLSPEERAKKDAERAGEKLGLNADQKTKWETAALERAKANRPLQEKMKNSATAEEKKGIHDQMKINKDKFNTTVVALLTPEQKIKYDQMQKEREARMQRAKDKHGKGPAHDTTK